MRDEVRRDAPGAFLGKASQGGAHRSVDQFRGHEDAPGGLVRRRRGRSADRAADGNEPGHGLLVGILQQRGTRRLAWEQARPAVQGR
jgi:hypothetical protein